MPEPLAPALARIRLVLLDAERLTRAVAAGRRRGVGQPAWRKVELRYVDLREGRRLQVIRYDERQAHTSNHTSGEAPGVLDELLAEPFGNWHVDTSDTSTQLRVTKRGEAQVHESARHESAMGESARRESAVEDAAAARRSHDRAKKSLLDPDEPFLAALGISDDNGRVKPTRRAKLRQVEEFLRALDPVLDRLEPEDGVLRVADLGCGNAYLTFAAYRWLTKRYGDGVRLVGVDVKAQARERNTELAQRLGWSQRMSFVEGAIGTVELDQPPHLVLALHACDTATDDALARAVRWQSRAIVAAPCCHHDLQTQVRKGTTPGPYGLLTRHGILRERLADGLTDALRAAILRLTGYRVEVIEFVDSAHTPRNVLLRAERTGAPAPADVASDYAALVTEWSIQPALARLLEPELTAALDAALR